MRIWMAFIFCAILLSGASSRAEEMLRECPNCPELVVIPAGQFVMGSPEQEQGRFEAEGPQHHVTVRAFALGKYPVTVDEFLAFLRDTEYQPKPCNPMLDLVWSSPGRGLAYPPGLSDSPHQPATCVSWQDAQAYIQWLNHKLHPQDSTPGPYRLPSEAEWEYAARAHTLTARWWGQEIGRNNANCNGCGSRWDNQLFAPVGSFGPNPFGLYDMLGNIWQWTDDCWNDSYVGAPQDGAAWTSGNCGKRVLRGGSWSNLPRFIRSAARAALDLNGQSFDTASDAGFRLARTIR